MQAILRRSRPRETGEQESGPVRFGDLCIDETARTVEVQDALADLTVREFDLLAFMARHPRQAFTRDALLSAVWGDEFAGDDSTVTVHMRRLREKIEIDPSRPRYLKTVWGVGYRFES